MVRPLLYLASVCLASITGAPASASSGPTTVRVSPASPTPGDATYGSVSADGRWVVFDALAPLVQDDTNDRVDVYLRDLYSGEVSLVSHADQGVRSFDPHMTPDARWIVYESRDALDGLVLYERATGLSTLVDARAGIRPFISADGRYAAHSTGLQVRAVDLVTGRLVSHAGEDPIISAGGEMVSFTHSSLSPEDDDDGLWDVHLTDLATGEIALLDTGLNTEVLRPYISEEGDHITFYAVPPEGQLHALHLYRLDRRSAELTLISTGAEPYDLPSVSADGSVVTFGSPGPALLATNPPGHDPLPGPGIYVWEAGRTTMVSVSSRGAPGYWARPHAPALDCFVRVGPACAPWPSLPARLGLHSSNPLLSSDGRFVVFDTQQRLDPSDVDDVYDVYLHDRRPGS